MKPVRHAHGHRHSPPGQHEHEHEPQHGLPEALPAGEHILWQGSPDWKTLAVRRFHARKLVIYFAAILGARLLTLTSDGAPFADALRSSLPMIALAVIAIGIALLMAWMTARTTVYTLTDKRVAMRIGIVLTLTLNLPLKRIEAADLNAHSGRIGDIALRLKAPDRIAFLHLWPHARPWRIARPEPDLLCVTDAPAVAARLTAAWSQVTGDAARPQNPAGSRPAGEMAPTLATR